MEINVSQIDEYDGLAIDHQYADGEPRLESEEGRLVGRTHLRLHASREGEDVLLRGTVNATVEFECGRCLTAFRIAVAPDFDLLYVATTPGRGAHEENELKEDDLSIAYYEGHIINLDDLAREQIELMLPMAHLCSETCRGLCPECGANLNEQDCACVTEQTDPRWDALRGLKPNP